MRNKPLGIVITCEHGGNRVPKQFTGLFHQSGNLLESHRGYDHGALPLAKKLSQGLKAPLYFSTLTRLFIDLNRSPGNPSLFSEITGRLSMQAKKDIQKRYYRPYRDEVTSAILRYHEKGTQVLHLSVHTFTPVLQGKVRTAAMGLLYDPARRAEAAFSLLWQRMLRALDPMVLTRRNYPYRGSSDGFTTYLRGFFPEDSYLGIELEVNQKCLSGDPETVRDLQQLILKSLARAGNAWNSRDQQNG